MWSPEEEDVLREVWRQLFPRQIMRLLPDRTWTAIYRRASDLGLCSFAPNGHETVWSAARRNGFDVQTMWRIIRWAGVTTHVVHGRELSRRRQPRRFACRLSIDEAVARWLSTETLRGAARARGINHGTLRRWLVESGVLPPRRERAACRVASREVDRVVAARSATASRLYGRRRGTIEHALPHARSA